MAALYLPSPACEARIEQVPGSSIVTVVPLVPLVVHTVVVWLANDTASPFAEVVPLTVKVERL